MTEEESQISYLTFHFKILEKLEQTDQSKQKEENNKNYWEKLVDGEMNNVENHHWNYKLCLWKDQQN